METPHDQDSPATPRADATDDHVAAVSPNEREVNEVAVVHAAAEIRYRIEERPAGWAILTSAADASTSARELREYAHENEESRRPFEPLPVVGVRGGWLTGVVWAVAIVVFHLCVTTWFAAMPWYERGASNAAKVLHGEHWRVVTALTLHADFPHVLSNAVACVLFVGVVARWLGPGLASLLVLLAGAGGNAFNAWLYATRHISLGASTATFAAVGLLGALQFGRLWSRAPSRRPAWLAIAASLGLFAMLGTSIKTDVMAHLAGLVAGFVVGIGAAAWMRARKAPGEVAQAVLAGSSAAAVVVCWLAALR